MKAKKITGYILIGLSSVLALAFVAQLSLFFKAILGAFGALPNDSDAVYTRSYYAGTIIYFVVHLTVTAALLIWGINWIKPRNK